MKTRFVLGSASAHELAALRGACAEFGLKAAVSSVRVGPCRYATPLGFFSIANQAGEIACAVCDESPAGILAVGIQNGAVRKAGSAWHAVDCIQVRSASETRLESWWTRPILLPADFARALFRRGVVAHGLSDVLKGAGVDPEADPYLFLTGGAVSREESLKGAFLAILAKLEARGFVRRPAP